MLCIGICGELLLHIHRWKSGFKHQVVAYQCSFSFSAFRKDNEIEEDTKKRAIARAEEWIAKIESMSSNESEVKQKEGLGNCKFIRLKEGHIYISFPSTSRRYDGEYYWNSYVDVYCQQIAVLNRIIELNQPYCNIYWILKEPINIKYIKLQRLELSRERMNSNVINQRKFSNSIDTTIIKNFTDLIDENADGIDMMKRHEEIRIVTGGSHIATTGSSIGLLFDGRPENAFFRAHSIFSPDILLSILL